MKAFPHIVRPPRCREVWPWEAKQPEGSLRPWLPCLTVLLQSPLLQCKWHYGGCRGGCGGYLWWCWCWCWREWRPPCPAWDRSTGQSPRCLPLTGRAWTPVSRQCRTPPWSWQHNESVITVKVTHHLQLNSPRLALLPALNTLRQNAQYEYFDNVGLSFHNQVLTLLANFVGPTGKYWNEFFHQNNW